MGYTYITDPGVFRRIVAREILPYLDKNKIIALDVETFSKFPPLFPRPISAVVVDNETGEKVRVWEGELSTLQLGADPNIYDRQWIIDIRKVGPELVTELLKSPLENALILAQNGKYDYGFLEAQLNISPPNWRDVMLVSQVISAGNKFSRSLAGLCRKYIDYAIFIVDTNKNIDEEENSRGMDFDQFEEFKKAMQKSNWSGVPEEDQLFYGALDVKLLFRIYEKEKEILEKIIKQNKKKNLMQRVKTECSLIPEFARIEMRGIKLNVKRLKQEISPYLENIMKISSKEVEKYFTREVEKKNGLRGKQRKVWTETEVININSPEQIKTALRGVGVELPVKDATGAKALKRVRDRHPAIRFIITHKKASSLNSKFAKEYTFFVGVDGKVHASFHQIGSQENGVDTGRSSSSDPNLQQVPGRGTFFDPPRQAIEMFRHNFTVDSDEYEFVDADYSQIEPRYTAEVTGDKVLRSEFNKGTDFHSLTAKTLLNLDELPLKGSYEREYIGKTANLSMSYGIGASKLADFMFDETIDNENPVVWTPEEAKLRREAYYEGFPAIRVKMTEVENMVRKALEPFYSLADFKNRRPIFTIFTENGHRLRSWYLVKAQEDMCKDYTIEQLKNIQHPLHKGNRVNGKTNWNEFNKTINRIAREAYNFLIQGECANILKDAILPISKDLIEIGCDPKVEGIVGVIHDEILAHVHKSRTAKAKEIITNRMKESGEKYIKSVPIKIGVGVGSTWYEAKS